MKIDSSTDVFLWILCKFSEYYFYKTPRWLLWHFIAIASSLIKMNLSDVSTIGCIVFFGNFAHKHLQLSLLFKLRLQLSFKYLKSQNKQVSLQTLSTKPHTNFMHFFLRHSRTVTTNLFKNTLVQWKFVYINGIILDVESSTRGYFVKKKIFYFSKTTLL